MSRIGNSVALAVMIAAAAVFPRAATAETVGSWNLEVDPMLEMVTAFRAEVRRQRALVLIEAAAYDISSDVIEPMDGVQKKELAREWQLAIVSELESYDFRHMKPDELPASQRQVFDDMREKLFEAMPFGMRARARAQFGEIFILLDDNEASCTAYDGAYGATVMSILPEAQVGSDYGSIAVVVFGLGACGQEGGYSPRRLVRLIEATKRVVVNNLEDYEDGQ